MIDERRASNEAIANTLDRVADSLEPYAPGLLCVDGKLVEPAVGATVLYKRCREAARRLRERERGEPDTKTKERGGKIWGWCPKCQRTGPPPELEPEFWSKCPGDRSLADDPDVKEKLRQLEDALHERTPTPERGEEGRELGGDMNDERWSEEEIMPECDRDHISFALTETFGREYATKVVRRLDRLRERERGEPVAYRWRVPTGQWNYCADRDGVVDMGEPLEVQPLYALVPEEGRIDWSKHAPDDWQEPTLEGALGTATALLGAILDPTDELTVTHEDIQAVYGLLRRARQAPDDA